MSSTDWMPNGGAPLLPKVSPYCVPEKMMELKRRDTVVYDLRGAGWQLRHKRAAPGAEVPWHRVHFWPVKMVPVITCQELFVPLKAKKKRAVVQKGPKVVKAPVRDKKFAARFVVRCDYQRVFQSFKKFVFGAQAATGAVQVASADAPTTRTLFTRPLVPGAFPGDDDDDDDAAADVGAQTESAAETEAQPSLLASIVTFGFKCLFGQRELKRAHEDVEDVAGDAKRRRVGLDAQAPARAEARPAAGKAARSDTTGATAPSHPNLTTSAAKRRARNAPKPSLKLCPPPTGSAPVAGNAKVVKALSMPPPPRPLAGRPTRKRADTPDPRAGTPPPSEPEASSAASTPTSSPSTSRSSSPAPSRSPSPSPSPAPKAKSSKSKSSSSKSKSSSESKSSSSKSKSSSSKSKSSSSSKSKSSSSSKSKSSSSKSQSSTSDSKSTSLSKSSSSSSKSTSSTSQSHSSSSKSYFRYTNKPISERSSLELASDPSTVSGSTAITLLPPDIRWSRDGGRVNPWDPRCPAAPDPRFPWAPVNDEWAGARAAPIAPLPDAPEAPSFVHPKHFKFHTAAGSSTGHCDRAASPAHGREGECEGGDETEVESAGEETDDEE